MPSSIRPLPSRRPEPFSGSLFAASSDDAEQQAALLRGWNQSYTQISRGKFFGSVAEIQLGGGRLFREFTGRSLHQNGVLPQEFIAIGLPLQMEGPAIFCGMQDDPGAMHIFSGNGGFDFYSPGELTMAGMVVPRQALSSLLPDCENDLILATFNSAHLARAEATAAGAVKEFINGVLEISESAPQLLGNEPIMTTLYQGMMSNLAALVVESSGVKPDRPGLARRCAIVAKAKDAVLSRPDRPICIAELCRIVGVSRRTLQYCFQDVLDLSPAAFLRAVRLNRVRRMLRDAPSVTEAAAFWGFWHFGHFARDYAAMFGELPSQTHRRFRKKPSGV